MFETSATMSGPMDQIGPGGQSRPSSHGLGQGLGAWSYVVLWTKHCSARLEVRFWNAHQDR
jgi:hypothetical protein